MTLTLRTIARGNHQRGGEGFQTPFVHCSFVFNSVLYQYSKSQHCHDKHPNNMSLSVFKVGLIKSCKAVDLDMEDSRFISLFRTGTTGLNRIKVIK